MSHSCTMVFFSETENPSYYRPIPPTIWCLQTKLSSVSFCYPSESFNILQRRLCQWSFYGGCIRDELIEGCMTSDSLDGCIPQTLSMLSYRYERTLIHTHNLYREPCLNTPRLKITFLLSIPKSYTCILRVRLNMVVITSGCRFDPIQLMV